jgi:hypothetical protein
VPRVRPVAAKSRSLRRSTNGRRRGRPRGSGTRSAEAFALVQAKPGITIRKMVYSELPPKHHHGLGRRRRVGVKRSTGVRLWTGAGGNDVTTSGSWRVFSAWSIAVASAGGVDISIGGEKIRLASPPHTGHPIASGAVPSARATSNAPSWSHRYSYVAMNGGPLSS